MKDCFLRRKETKILLISFIILAASIAFAGDVEPSVDQLKLMFFGQLVAFTLWLLKSIYDMFLKKNDNLEKKIDEIFEKLDKFNSQLQHIDGRLETFITKDEAQDVARETLNFYHDVRKK